MQLRFQLSPSKPCRPLNPPAKDFQDLIVWQKSHQFVLSTYRLYDLFPKNEMYGLALLLFMDSDS